MFGIRNSAKEYPMGLGQGLLKLANL